MSKKIKIEFTVSDLVATVGIIIFIFTVIYVGINQYTRCNLTEEQAYQLDMSTQALNNSLSDISPEQLQAIDSDYQDAYLNQFGTID